MSPEKHSRSRLLTRCRIETMRYASMFFGLTPGTYGLHTPPNEHAQIRNNVAPRLEVAACPGAPSPSPIGPRGRPFPAAGRRIGGLGRVDREPAHRSNLSPGNVARSPECPTPSTRLESEPPTDSIAPAMIGGDSEGGATMHGSERPAEGRASGSPSGRAQWNEMCLRGPTPGDRGRRRTSRTRTRDSARGRES